MYDELRETWKREFENIDLEKLPPDFYSRVADYLRRLREEGRMLDKRTTKARLLKIELQHVRLMLHELTQARYKKMFREIAKGEKLQSDVLTVEEQKMCIGFSPFAETYHNFVKNLLRGQLLGVTIEREHKIAALRFLKDVPAIIGVDMKTYGPFTIEDVASLPSENANILIKQGFTEKIELR